MNNSYTQTKSIRFPTEMVNAISILKDKEDSFSSYIKTSLSEKIERDHGIPIDQITSHKIIDRIKGDDFSIQTLEKIKRILESEITMKSNH